MKYYATIINFQIMIKIFIIPVGEVFTSPKLTGTNGVLHVGEVYLNDLKFIDLEITFKDGIPVLATTSGTNKATLGIVKKSL